MSPTYESIPPFSRYGQGDAHMSLWQILKDSGYDPDVAPFPGLPALTKGYNAALFTGATNEAKITAAIAKAVADGKTYVWVPQSMLPYNASLVTFNLNVTMIREGGNPSVFDVMAYGAKGDGIQDDTAAFLGAIAGALGTGDPTLVTRFASPIYMPGGRNAGAQAVYHLTSELLIRSAQGLRFYGDGQVSTVLSFGANLTNGLNLDGVAHSTFEGFAVRTEQGFTLTNMINCHWGTGTQRNPTGVVFRSIQVGGGSATAQFVNGFAIGTDNANAVDGFTFERCEPLGTWTAGNVTTYQNGFLLGNGTGGNNLDHCFYNCECQGVRYGTNFAGSNGWIYGGQNENCGTDFLLANTLAPVKISGFRSEGATAFLALPGSASAVNPCEIENVDFAGNGLTAAQTYQIIDYNWAGMLIIRNFRIYNVANAAAVCVVRAGAGNNDILTVMVDGFCAPNSQTIPTTFITQGGGPTAFDIRGFSARNNAENLNLNFVPRRLYNPTLVAGNVTDGALFNSIATMINTPTEAVLVSGINARLGNQVIVTLTAARLVGAPLNPQVGQALTFTFIQGGAGAFAVTWNAVFKKIWSDVGNATGTRSSITFAYDGTNWNQISGQALYV